MTYAQRRALGSAILVAYIIFYIILVITVAPYLPLESVWAQLIFYPVVGLGWIFPLKPLLHWMGRP